jgi:hypothetical protein
VYSFYENCEQQGYGAGVLKGAITSSKGTQVDRVGSLYPIRRELQHMIVKL